MAASTSTAAAPMEYKCDVFINHRGPDVKKTFASHLYRRLLSHGLTPFLDLPELHHGEDFASQIKSAITTARIHVAIFSPRYAESSWCLNELVLILETGATILPVYYGVRPYELRRPQSVYGEAFAKHAARFDFENVERWRMGLSVIASTTGFDLEAYNGDEGLLLENLVETLLKKCEKPRLNVFINHRGPDVKNTFASYLYHRLRYHGMQVFLDREGLQGGDNLSSTIEAAIKSASVHVAVFSPRYAESVWCLKELVLMKDSGAPIIPVFYHVKPAELRWTRVKSKLCWKKPTNRAYAQALQKLERKGRCDSSTIENWRDALSHVSDTSGLDLETFKGDEGALLEKLVERLLKFEEVNRGVDSAQRV